MKAGYEQRVFVNGAARTVDDGTTIGDLIAEHGAANDGVAAALNGAVIAKNAWATTPVANGDRLEILTAAPGG